MSDAGGSSGWSTEEWVADRPTGLPRYGSAAPPPVRRRAAGRWWVTGLAVLVGMAVIAAAGLIRSNRPPAAAPTPTVTDIQTSLANQAKALENGDEAGWLAPVDPSKSDLVARYREQFRALHALHVTSFQPILDNDEVYDARQAPSPSVTLTVYFGFCAQTPVCPAVIVDKLDGRQTTESFSAKVTWSRADVGYQIVDYTPIPPAANAYDHLPWLDSRLEFASSSRVVVAASAGLAGRLPAALAQADAAAAVADQFAHWVKPTHYVVYLANPTEWATWFSGPTVAGKELYGYAANTSRSSDVVVLNQAVIDAHQVTVTEVLRHEFGHVVTLLATSDRSLASRLLIEGIADYIQGAGRPISAYYGLSSVRGFVRGGSWDGDLEQVVGPFFHPDDAESLVYGMGFLTWHCIADRFGMAKLFDFAGQAIRDLSYDVAKAAQATLGQPWTAVKATCADYIRTAMR